MPASTGLKINNILTQTQTFQVIEFTKVDLSTETGKQKFIQMIEGRKVNIKNRVSVSVESDLNEIFDIFENKNKQEIDELRKGIVFLLVFVI